MENMITDLHRQRTTLEQEIKGLQIVHGHQQ